MEKNERHCERVFSNGDAYVGNMKQELPHGNGRYTWSDETVYEGEWEEGKMTGKGRICWSSGATYEGDFSGGYVHGLGTFTAVDGSVYVGAWRMNVQHGLGRKKYSNLDVYEGSWREGIHEGSGRYSWYAGNTYTGNWKAGNMCGRGAMKWENGDLFDGFWLDGLRHGSGFYRFADGGYYFGTWTKGLKDGKGTFYPVGAKLPSLKKWYNSVGYYDMKHSLLSHTSSANLEDFDPKKPRVKRSLSEKLSIGGIFRSPGRISLRAKSLDGAFRVGDPVGEAPLLDSSHSLSFSSNEDQNKVQDHCNLVYEREYMQGVLIKERVRNDAAELSHKNKWRNKIQPKEQRKKPGQAIFKGHRSYYLMLNLQLGIRYTVGKITPVPMREVRSSDFGPRARIRMYFPRNGSKLTPPHKSIDFYWKDYCPMVFRNLREMFKIDAADYMMSICGGDGLRELSSPGKSGSIFYLSKDERFVIKTQRRSELKVRFVVMGNMFCTELRIHRRYDLKGSTQGRCTNKHEIDENTTLKDLDLSYVFQMDKSWRKSLFKQISLDCMFLESQCIIDYSLLLGLHFRAPEHLKALADSSNALHRESSDEGVSHSQELLIPPKGLLLVTHEPNSVNTLPGPHIRGSTLRAAAAGDEEVDLFLPDTGRLRVQLGVNMPAQAIRKVPHVGAESTEIELVEVYDVVLYLGIIDILQEYNIKKKIEHAYKSLLFDPLSISAVEPKVYSKRFISFLERVFPDQM
ncbi:phosphatidylinositol 4-phosphate 5-kinase 8-like isoform X2 [Telopea speciosissima]|uniref:phosphatidylinositol 4-phosphate 5-kinase 8-like isoform X2 n=1 Tax=Telopea speciosissima TaxID=54955 RepID=UPI001CC7F1A3|nr:phosphatidylinositol 4-phosphate 5-kinase 8-like isoform X2 [Telopea speciosissima]